MSQSKLTELILELEKELEKFDPNNTNKIVTQVEQDLAVLKTLDLDKNHEDHSFLEAAIQFKESHPKLASTLNDIAYLLNNIGI